METPRLRAFRMAGAGDALVVTFSNYVEPGGASAAFGEHFFAQHGIAAIHVVAKDNHWFELEEVEALVALVRAEAAGRRLFAYGSSMGGYAALRWAGALGARAVAISPQYALDRARMPGERRWREEARRVRLAPEAAGPGTAPAILVFDPRNPDARHAAAWAARVAVEPVALPHAGHPAGTFLLQTELLADSLRAIVAGRFDPAETMRSARARRGRSARYLAQLAAAQPAWRRGCALALSERAVALAPGAGDHRGALAILLYRAGRDREAEAAHRAALEVASGDPLALFRLSRFLQRTGRYPEALELAEAAVRADAGSRALRRHRRRLLNALRPPTNPLRLWARALDRLHHWHNRAGWARGWALRDRLARP